MFSKTDFEKVFKDFLNDFDKPVCNKCKKFPQEFIVENEKLCWRCIPKNSKKQRITNNGR